MIYFAHRGASKNYPENTLLAFHKAIIAGAKAIELDVHKTKDNKLVVIHDEDVARTFQGKGLIKDLTLEEISSFKSKNIDYENSKLCKIPTLYKVLELLKPSKVLINIELKTDVIHYKNIEKDVIDLIKNYGIENHVLLSSFNHTSLEICKSIDKNIKLGVLIDRKIDNIIAYAKNLGAYSLNPNVYLVNEPLIKLAHNNNLKVFTYTVNKPFIANHLDKIGCDGIFTDNIEKFI
ncbi:glycerophosphodiester phosphodiesterase [Clostridium sulfidigenes]|uniref:Glycerophosphodiester phosphodiesterase n=1 Tax=Clostridium sulfidigenes TaxID=318464 RepID=A0A084JBY7_9CLOT|nr:glycerophosphodiester phosphodiesterase family protein [Clostridium sulfidigenes]KEZ86471.1 glycerophosphodiester phosphodiesterase [Clostridium sulfidigenes]